MAFLARNYGYAPGMGAAAAGGFPGLSPQTLAFIEGLKQQQQEAQVGQQRHEERMEMLRRQFGMQEEDARFKRYQYERDAAEKSYKERKGEKRERGGILAGLAERYHQQVDQILQSDMTPEQKQVAMGQARNRLGQFARLIVGEDVDLGSVVGETPSVDQMQQQIAQTPRAMAPEEVQQNIADLGQVQSKDQYYNLLRKLGGELGEFDRLPGSMRGALRSKFATLPTEQAPSLGEGLRTTGQALSQLPDIWNMLTGKPYQLQFGKNLPVVPRPTGAVQQAVNMFTGG